VAHSKDLRHKDPLKQTLLVLNYAMSEKDPIFSHQADAVVALARNFEKVVVISQNVGRVDVPANVLIVDLKWRQGKNVSNTLKFLSTLIRICVTEKPNLVFSHMTERLSLLASLPLKVLGIQHFLWYAHTSASRSLKISAKLVDKIFTSTPGSCPIDSSKVHVLGQAIDLSKFNGTSVQTEYPTNFIHVGRLDSSKNIQLLIDQVLLNNSTNRLTLVGAPSNPASSLYWDSLKAKNREMLNSKKLIEVGPVPRSELPNLLRKHEVFIHAFEGSLDKSILEATACGLPVITTNPEYLSIFGCWSQDSSRINLESEYTEFLKTPLGHRMREIQRRTRLLSESHSFEVWIDNLTRKMTEDVS